MGILIFIILSFALNLAIEGFKYFISFIRLLLITFYIKGRANRNGNIKTHHILPFCHSPP